MDYDQPLDLSLPKKTSGVMMTRKIKTEKTDNLFNDTELLVLPSSKTNLLQTTNFETLGTIDASKSVSLSADTDDDLHANPLENYINNSRVTEVSDPAKYFGSVDESISSSTGGVSHCVDHDDDDDNCSIVSLDTPSLSGIDDDLWMDDEVEAILVHAIKNSPKLISPIKDLPQKRRRQLNEYEECEQINRKSNPTESHCIADFCNTAKRSLFAKSASKGTNESSPPEHSNGSNESTENIVGTTIKIDKSEPATQRTAYKSTINFKDLEKLTINVGDLNSTRTVSLSNPNLPTPMVTHVQPVPQPTSVPLINVPTKMSARMVSNPHSRPTVTHAQPVPQPTPAPLINVPTLVPKMSTRMVPNPNLRPMVTHAQPVPQPTPVPLINMPTRIAHVERMLSVPAQSPVNVGNLHSTRTAMATQAACNVRRLQPPPPPVQIVPPMGSVRGNLNSPSPNWQPDDALSPDKKQRYTTAAMRLFEHPCVKSLSGRACEQPCQYYHRLPPTDRIFEKMKTYPDAKIHFIYSSFIVKYMTTFSQYFPMICYLFGSRKMKEALASSVQYCNSYRRYEFYRFIFGGLMMCGLQDWEALQIFDRFADICEASVAALIEIGKNPTNPFQS